MRMWMLNPKLLCRNHLLGEHNEIHKHKHVFEKHYSIFGRIHPAVLIEPDNMKKRHDDLVLEMLERGYNHQSPYEQPPLSYLPDDQRCAKVDMEYNLKDLYDRCPECRSRMKG
jgi:predicted Ser/Thr protein kinase